MSSEDDKSRESSPARSTSETRGSSARPRQGPPNIIAFVDSQDPNVKSAIQRHTAYHSAAQRREARMQSLRRGTQSRYLDWGRRQGSESVQPRSPESSSSSPYLQSSAIQGSDTVPGSLSTSSASLFPRAQPLPQSRRSSGSSSPTPPTLTSAEDAILQFCRLYLLSQHRLVASNQDSIIHLREVLRTTDPNLTSADLTSNPEQQAAYEATISFMRTDEACTNLLLAHSHSLRARIQDSESNAETDRQAAQTYLARGTNVLRNRLRDSDSRGASSDPNIQAVLLLVSYSADFGQPGETDIHSDALRTMVQQRGGLEGLAGNVVLHRQLVAADTARRYHLTLSCTADCCRELRFPNGFWGGGQQQQ